MINFEAAHGFCAVGNHACEFVALCLLAALGLAFHCLGGNRPTTGKHDIVELGGLFRQTEGEFRLRLLMPERIDGIKSGGAAGGHEFEDDANGGEKDESDDVDLWIEKEWRSDNLGEGNTKAIGEKDTCHVVFVVGDLGS